MCTGTYFVTKKPWKSPYKPCRVLSGFMKSCSPALQHAAYWCSTYYLVSQFDEGLWQQWLLPSTEISFGILQLSCTWISIYLISLQAVAKCGRSRVLRITYLIKFLQLQHLYWKIPFQWHSILGKI